MAQITSGATIRAQDFYDTFFSRFTQFANQSITYGTNNYHFGDMPPEFNNTYGGPTSGISQEQPSWRGINPGATITASNIHDYVIGLSVIYCRIRNVSVKRIVTATVGMTETSETRSGISNMSSSFAAPGFSNPSSINNIYVGNTIYASNLLSFIDDCYNQYRTNQRTNTLAAEYSVCHNSCHASCHGSRGRR